MSGDYRVVLITDDSVRGVWRCETYRLRFAVNVGETEGAVVIAGTAKRINNRIGALPILGLYGVRQTPIHVRHFQEILKRHDLLRASTAQTTAPAFTALSNSYGCATSSESSVNSLSCGTLRGTRLWLSLTRCCGGSFRFAHQTKRG
jgi:hypothetical protein